MHTVHKYLHKNGFSAGYEDIFTSCHTHVKLFYFSHDVVSESLNKGKETDFISFSRKKASQKLEYSLIT